MPFGLSVLKILLGSEGRVALVGKSLEVQTGVNLRSDCPTVIQGSAYYAPAKTQLIPTDTVTPKEILALNYLDDVFYWARGNSSRGNNAK